MFELTYMYISLIITSKVLSIGLYRYKSFKSIYYFAENLDSAISKKGNRFIAATRQKKIDAFLR